MKKGFSLYNFNKPGAGVVKKKEKKFTFKRFFFVLKNKFWKIVVLNGLFVFLNFPIFFGLAALTGNFNIHFITPADALHQPLFGISQYTSDPLFLSFWGVGGHETVSGYAGTVAMVLYCLCALVIFTFGLTNLGMTYVLRNFAKEEHSDIGEDFFSAIKRNWKQGIILGIIDILFIIVIIFDLSYFYYSTAAGAVSTFMLFAMVLLAFIYFFMRFYMYNILVTFKLPIYKILKNSFIFSILGFKRNFIAGLAIFFVVLLNYVVYIFFNFLGAILLFAFTFAFITYISTFVVYPNIKRYMIDPYYEEKEEEVPEEEPIFQDRG